MDLDYVLRWIAGISSVVALLRLLQSRSPARTGWIVVSITVLLVLVAGTFLFPDYAGSVAFFLWTLLMLGPSLLYRLIQRDMFRQNHTRARRIALIARILHPADGFWQYPELIRAYELAALDRPQDAEPILVRLQSRPGWLGDTARLHLMRFRGDWEGVLEWCSRIPAAQIGRSADSVTLLLRALGETGRLNEMIQTFKDHSKVIHRYPANLRDLTRMFLYSFSGRIETVARLFRGSLSLYPAVIRDFWMATAEIAAGSPEGRGKLEAIHNTSDAMVRAAVEFRLRRDPVSALQELTPTSVQILDEEEEVLSQEERYERTSQPSFKPAVTMLLIAANGLYFLLEILRGGSMSARALFELGAVVPSVVLSGEWWRLLAAQFLHYGWVHLAMNMLGLYLLGPFVERHLGHFRYAFLYLVCGTASFLTIVLLTSAGRMEEGLVVGASGSILALIGATGAILIRGWAREGAIVARRRLSSIGLIVALQVVFDVTTPQVSFVAHMSGTVFGLLAAFLLLPGTPNQPRTQAR